MFVGWSQIPTLVFPSNKVADKKALRTHRDVKELLCAIQHTDPDGDMPSRGHGRGFVPGVQCTDAKTLRGSKTLPCSRDIWIWLCHGALLTAHPAQRPSKSSQDDEHKDMHSLNSTCTRPGLHQGITVLYRYPKL